MKRKHVITTLALSMLLGVGVFAGITANRVREAKADGESTLYCKMAYDWWKADGAAIGVHYWGGDTSTDYPGVRGTKVTSDTDVWKFEVPSNSTGLIFTRVSGTGAVSDYGAKTADLTIPTDGKNLYTISSSSPVWGDPGVDGSWSAYVEPTPAVTYDVHVVVDGVNTGVQHIDEGNLPADPTMAYGQVFSGWFDDAACTKGHEVEEITSNTTVYGKVTNAEKVTFALDTSKVSTVFTGTLNLYAWDNNGKNADWPGVEIADVNAIELPNTVKAVINNGTVQTVDVTTLKNNDTLRILNDKDEMDHYKVQWQSDADEPAEDGYYIVGTESNWKYEGATKMDAGDDGDLAKLINYQAKAGEEFKVRSYLNGVDTYYNLPDSEENYKVGETAKALDIFLNAYGKFYVFDHEEPVVDHDYALIVNGGTPIALTKSGEEYYVEGITVAAGDTFTFTKDEAAYAVTAEDVGNNNYGKNGVRQAGTVNLYLKPASDHFWVSGLPAPEADVTYYMLINDKNPVKMTDNTDITANEFYLTHVELAADDEVSFMYISEAQESPVYTHYNITTVEGIEDFYKEGNVVKTAGIYDLYADMTPDHNKLYVAINHDGWVRYLDINGEKQAMVVNPDNEKEYKLIANLAAGDELAYYYGADAESATEQTSSAKAIYNNNLGADKKVLVDAQGAEIYVNIETGEIWVGGITTAGYHIIKNGHTLVAMTHGDEFDGYDQWFSASIEFAKDDEITFINATEARGNQLPEIFGIGTVEESDEGAKFEVVEGTPKVIKAKEAVTTKVYLKLKYGMDRVYFGAEDQYIHDAKVFANQFKADLDTACKASGQQKAVEDAWKDAVDAFALLAKETKDELKLGALSSVEEVREFGARYTWFLEHKSTWNLDNFLEWEIQASNDVMGLTADDTTMTVVVISAIAVISAAGLFFLIRRKRRLVK